MTVKKYQDPIAWQKAIALVAEIYEASKNFPRDEISRVHPKQYR